jgi:S-adenosylmethionine:tRNA-ribosyltransferase-isomerase (queuine synthetase)
VAAPPSDGEPAGETPLPPYITEPLADPERYQTVVRA